MSQKNEVVKIVFVYPVVTEVAPLVYSEIGDFKKIIDTISEFDKLMFMLFQLDVGSEKANYVSERILKLFHIFPEKVSIRHMIEIS